MYERLKMLRHVFVCLRRQGTGLTMSVSNSCHSQKLGTYAEHTLTHTHADLCCWQTVDDQMHAQITYTQKHAHIQYSRILVIMGLFRPIYSRVHKREQA